eukprot:CAMPEP_0178453030 /NCGR_PEP_ID=MMETSP0689_2-20121128/44577_1 /TAXON_ID=160604 /ORGANISM="Amphidinium massartii, Strain CS-259" /LENGTH=935 /DNA_ID=CAMNT_0020078809 /DNA_START=75 /DNA_END=2881 /DNA_ORIENTATION=-
MAAIIAAHLHSDSDDDHEEDVAASHALEAFEFGLDKVTVGDIAAHVHELGVNVNILHERLLLESTLASALVKLPCFCIAMASFVFAILVLVPSAALSEVHTHIRNHFQVYQANLDAVGSYEDIYVFAAAFQSANEELQATGPLYWCEGRYFEYVFDDNPRRYCPSPRLNSLGYAGETPTTWAQWQSSGGPSRRRRGVYGVDAEVSSSANSGEHRRLDEQTNSAMRLSDTAKRRLADSHGSNTSCVDDDVELQLEEGDSSLTCENYKAHVCDIDLGVRLCPVTCGYCPPFVYQRSAKFDQPLVTMMPVMMYQSRHPTTACTGFAKTYEEQPHNEDLLSSPPLDGVRLDPVLTCIDRTQRFDGDYAFYKKCPGNFTLCTQGDDGNFYLRDSQVHSFHGEPVYAKFLAEPEKFIGAMQAIGWLDKQTEKVTLSTLVYTEGMEIFTSVSVVFAMDEAGNIEGSLEVISMHDLVGGTKTGFLVALSVTFALSFVGLVLTARNLLQNTACKWGFEMYELLTRILLSSYSLVLMLQWLQKVPMAEEFDSLLHTVLDFHGHGSEAWEELIDSYFDVSTNIYEETQWLYANRVVIFIVCYAQFLQLIFYFAAHPRLALITSTISYGADAMLHFASLFTAIFIFLAYMGHWMLGADIEQFETVQSALIYMVDMFFGDEFVPYAARQSPTATQVIAWVHASAYFVIVFLCLINFFLAVVVDAFMANKRQVDACLTAKSCFVDVVDVLVSQVRYWRNRWPRRSKVIEMFSQEDGGEVSVHSSDTFQFLLQKTLAAREAEEAAAAGDAKKVEHARCPAGQCLLWKNPGREDALILPLFTATNFLAKDFKSEERLLSFLAYYYKKVPEIFVHIEEDVNKEAVSYEKTARASLASIATSQGHLSPDGVTPVTEVSIVAEINSEVVLTAQSANLADEPAATLAEQPTTLAK